MQLKRTRVLIIRRQNLEKNVRIGDVEMHKLWRHGAKRKTAGDVP